MKNVVQLSQLMQSKVRLLLILNEICKLMYCTFKTGFIERDMYYSVLYIIVKEEIALQLKLQIARTEASVTRKYSRK